MDIYRRLRDHFDVMPVGFPKSWSEIELDILRRFFDEDEALVALNLSMLPETADRIYRRMGKGKMPRERVHDILENLDSKKVLNSSVVRRRGEEVTLYGKLPFVVGLYEYQGGRLTRDFEAEATQYMDETFMYEYVREKPQQMRTIPVNETFLPDRGVSRYDSIRNVILEAEGPFVAQGCICREGRELMGEKCLLTDRKDTCLALGAAAERVLKEGRGTEMTRDETLEFLEKAEAEGLVLQAQNNRNPVFICCCCSCCCGILTRVKQFPDPGNILKSNYLAAVDTDACTGCGRCLRRCPMNAISLTKTGKRSAATIRPERCIGCGLCVSTCPAGALSMRIKEKATDPPRTAMVMYVRMFINRFGVFKGGFLLLKAVLGFRV